MEIYSDSDKDPRHLNSRERKKEQIQIRLLSDYWCSSLLTSSCWHSTGYHILHLGITFCVELYISPVFVSFVKTVDTHCTAFVCICVLLADTPPAITSYTWVLLLDWILLQLNSSHSCVSFIPLPFTHWQVGAKIKIDRMFKIIFLLKQAILVSSTHQIVPPMTLLPIYGHKLFANICQKSTTFSNRGVSTVYHAHPYNFLCCGGT